MSQNVKVIARTFECLDDTVENLNNDMKLLSGKTAGICYMPNSYDEIANEKEEKTLKRAEDTAGRGHHSVYDHGNITLLVESNKMMCMILNSLGVYATSEKSARYTAMEPETELENKMYTKWLGKIQELIVREYPYIDDAVLQKEICKRIDKNVKVKNGQAVTEDLEHILEEVKQLKTLPSYKLAQENARYMISVFTPTVMAYTVSYRQLCLIIDYLDKLYSETSVKTDTLSKKLCKSVDELNKQFKQIIPKKPVNDTKNQYIRFFEQYDGAGLEPDTKKSASLLTKEKTLKKERIGDSYTLVYKGSLAMLAQAERHRTLRYSMYLNEVGKFGYYVPEIVKMYNYTEEWLEDIKQLRYCVPQGTIVRITEQGMFEDFVLKCKERLCGRAQLEIMLSTKENLEKFIINSHELSPYNYELLKSITNADITGIPTKVVMRCEFKDYKCSDNCTWGKCKASERLI